MLRGLSLSVPEGQIVALLGSNGAGKSTTLKAVAGLLPSEHGEVTQGSVVYQGKRHHPVEPGRRSSASASHWSWRAGGSSST